MRGFSDEERDRIREHLIESGQTLFAQFGLERTRIKDITAEVEIGTSTFYQFFDSKEALYVEVLLREHQQFHETIETAIPNEEPPRTQLECALRTLFDEIESSPLLYRLIVEGELRSLQTRLSESQRAELLEQIHGTRLTYIDEWVEDPSFRSDDPELVDGLLRTLVFVSRSKNVGSETGERSGYEAVKEFLIDVAVDGLFADS